MYIYMIIYRFEGFMIFWLKVLGFTQSGCVDRTCIYLGDSFCVGFFPAPEFSGPAGKYTKTPWRYVTRFKKHIVY